MMPTRNQYMVGVNIAFRQMAKESYFQNPIKYDEAQTLISFQFRVRFPHLFDYDSLWCLFGNDFAASLLRV